jgi:hypothetical protein
MREITSVLPSNLALSSVVVYPIERTDNMVRVRVSIKGNQSIFGGRRHTKIEKPQTFWKLQWFIELMLGLMTSAKTVAIIDFIVTVLEAWLGTLLQALQQNIDNILNSKKEFEVLIVSRIVAVNLTVDGLYDDKGYRDGDKFGHTAIVYQDDYGAELVTGKAFINRRTELMPLLGIAGNEDFYLELRGKGDVKLTVNYVLVELQKVSYSEGIVKVDTDATGLEGNQKASWEGGFEATTGGSGFNYGNTGGYIQLWYGDVFVAQRDMDGNWT